LKRGRTRLQKVDAGLHERVYRSRYTVPPRNEGVDVAGVPGRGNGGGQVALGFEQTFQYLGHYQPYGIYIPKGRAPYGMQMLFPDRFAGAVDWVGFTGDDANGAPPGSPHYTAGAVGNAPDYVANLRWVPTAMLYAGADELVHVWTGQAMDSAFGSTDDVFTFF